MVSRSADSSAPWPSTDARPGLDDRAVWPHEGIHPAQVGELASRMYEMGMNPAPILLVHEGPADVRALLRVVAAAPRMWSTSIAASRNSGSGPSRDLAEI